MNEDALAAVAELSARGVLGEAWSPQARAAAAKSRLVHGTHVGSPFMQRHVHAVVEASPGAPEKQIVEKIADRLQAHEEKHAMWTPQARREKASTRQQHLDRARAALEHHRNT